MAQRFLSDINLGDNIYLRFGNREEAGSVVGDFTIRNNGSNTFIDNSTGNIYIRNYSDDKNIHFQTDNGSGGVTDYIVIHGEENIVKFQEHTRHLDSKQARFGTGSDLIIHHNSVNSFIQNSNGNLYIDNDADDADIVFRSDDGSGGLATYFYLDGGSVNTRFVRHARFTDGYQLQLGNSADMAIFHSGTNSFIQNATGDLYIDNDKDDGDIIFRSDDGGGGKTTYFALDGGLERNIFYKTIRINGAGAGYLKTDANGDVSIDTDTIEDTLQSVTDRGASTDNAITISTSTNRTLTLDYTSGTGSYSLMSFKQSGTEQFRLWGSYTDNYLSFYNDQASVHQLKLNSDGSTTFEGDLNINKTDPKITLFDNSGVNTDPSGSIVFSESSGMENFDITYNGTNDRLEFRGRVSGSDNVDLMYISRQLTTPLQVQGGATFVGDIELDENLTFTTNNYVDIANTGTGAMRFKPSGSTLALTLAGANATFEGDITAGNSSTAATIRAHHDDGSYVDHTGYGMVFARNASYLRPNNDGARTMYFGQSSLTWNAIVFDSNSYTFQKNGVTLSLLEDTGMKVYSTIGSSDNVRTGLAHYDDTAQGAGVGGQLVLGYKYTDAGAYTEGAIIKMYKENGTSGNYASGLKFQVRNTGEDLSTKLTLTSDGELKGATLYEMKNNAGDKSNATSPRIYSPSSGTFGLSAGGAERLTINSTGATFAGDVTVTGDLVVNGTETILNTQTVEVEDNIIVLNKTNTSMTATTSGISVYRGTSAAASFIFDDSDDYWDLTHNLAVAVNGKFGTVGATNNSSVKTFDGSIVTKVQSQTAGDTAGVLGTESNHVLKLVTNNTTALTINTSQNATFAGSGTFTTDSSTARVLYLEAGSSNGNIIQFVKSGTNKWEVVGRDGTFYVYKNDGTGSGYKWQINTSGEHTFTGNSTFASDLTISGGDLTVGSASNNGTVTIRSLDSSSSTRTAALDFNIAGTHVAGLTLHNNTSGIATNTLAYDFQGSNKLFIFSDGGIQTEGKGVFGVKVQGPIFYDSTSTTYYLDPAATGTALNLAGAIQLPDAKAIMWAGNNIISHNGTQTYIGDNATSSALTVTGGNLSVENGAVNGVTQYTKSYGSLDTTGQAVAGLVSSSNGASAMFVFETGGGNGSGGYQKVVYNCLNVSGTWSIHKDIDEGGNRFDVTASSGSTVTFTFKARSSTQNYSPKVIVKAIGGSAINTSYV